MIISSTFDNGPKKLISLHKVINKIDKLANTGIQNKISGMLFMMGQCLHKYTFYVLLMLT